MAKKEFSQDYTQKLGNTPLNYRVLVEDPASGLEYWATVEQIQAILAKTVDEKLPSSSISDLVRTNNMGKILSDTTYAAPWETGFTIDEMVFDENGCFYNFKKNNHGLQNGDVVEFDANGGTLPGGIEAYNYRPSGAYYNVINATANSFNITETTGGVFSKPLTTTGAGAWRLRRSNYGSFVPLPDFSNYNNVKIVFIIQYAFRSTTPVSIFLKVNGDSNDFILGSSVRNAMYPDSVSYSKYTTALISVDLSTIEPKIYNFDLLLNKISTTNFNEYQSETKAIKALQYCSNTAQGFYIGSNNAIHLQFRSIRAIIIQQ